MHRFFERHSIERNGDDLTLVLYLNPGLTEFARELIDGRTKKQQTLLEGINSYVQQNLSDIKIKTVKLMIGAMLVAIFPFGGTLVYAQESTAPSPAETLNEQSIQSNYTVKPGDSIWTISRSFNVSMDSIRTANNLSTDMIYVGQSLTIPESTQESTGAQHNEGLYEVQAGDTLYLISRKFNTTVQNLKSLNTLNSDMIYIGQKLKVPTANSITNSASNANNGYTVVAGDTLWLVAKKLNTTIENLKQVNNLENDTIYIGQVLKTDNDLSIDVLSTPSAPYTTYSSHVVGAGENAWSISLKYGIPASELLEANDLTQSSVLHIGQTLQIPVHNIPVKPTPGPQYGERLDWWSEAQYLIPIGKAFKVTDFNTGKSFMIKRTIGANHADCEPLTAADSAIIKDIWGGSYSWTPRAVIIYTDGRNIAASMSSMPHSIQHIDDNDFEGHFDIHFLNSTRHSDGIVDQGHQYQINLASGIK